MNDISSSNSNNLVYKTKSNGMISPFSNGQKFDTCNNKKTGWITKNAKNILKWHKKKLCF